MHDFKEQAMSFLQRKDFSGLQKFLVDPPADCLKVADEISLLSLVEQGVSNEVLERPLDNYISKYEGEVPLSNIVTAARLKFELGKMEDALDLLRHHNVPQTETEATEIAVLCLYNLDRYSPGKALVDYLLTQDRFNPRYHEWNILFSYKVSELSDVINSWNAFVENQGSFTQRIGVLGFVIRSFMAFGRLDEAQAVYDEYELAKDIDNVSAAMFIADFEKQKGNFKGCIEILERMKCKHPEIAEVRWNLSLCQMAYGSLSEAWQNYEARWEWVDFTSPKRKFDAPRWDGKTNLDSKNILIWGEQGVGDQLRFLTLLPNVLADYPNANIYLEVDQKLIKLVRTWYPEASDVWPMGLNDTNGVAEYAKFDYQIPSGSLPAIYCNSEDKLHTLRYRTLGVSDQKRSDLLGDFGQKYKTVVGISWRSMLLTKDRINDYVNAEAFKSLIAEAPTNVGFVLLQYAIQDEEKALFKGFDNV